VRGGEGGEWREGGEVRAWLGGGLVIPLPEAVILDPKIRNKTTITSKTSSPTPCPTPLGIVYKREENSQPVPPPPPPPPSSSPGFPAAPHSAPAPSATGN